MWDFKRGICAPLSPGGFTSAVSRWRGLKGGVCGGSWRVLMPCMQTKRLASNEMCSTYWAPNSVSAVDMLPYCNDNPGVCIVHIPDGARTRNGACVDLVAERMKAGYKSPRRRSLKAVAPPDAVCAFHAPLVLAIATDL